MLAPVVIHFFSVLPSQFWTATEKLARGGPLSSSAFRDKEGIHKPKGFGPGCLCTTILPFLELAPQSNFTAPP